jgi:hypothetical protein
MSAEVGERRGGLASRARAMARQLLSERSQALRLDNTLDFG